MIVVGRIYGDSGHSTHPGIPRSRSIPIYRSFFNPIIIKRHSSLCRLIEVFIVFFQLLQSLCDLRHISCIVHKSQRIVFPTFKLFVTRASSFVLIGKICFGGSDNLLHGIHFRIDHFKIVLCLNFRKRKNKSNRKK